MEKDIIEVELRGQISKKKFIRVSEYLRQNCDSYKEDNKITYFFITTGFILKVTDEETKQKAKITIKTGDETQSVLKEFDIQIPRKSIEDAVFLFKNIGFGKVNKVEQTRTNYECNGISVAMKYTADWGYHFEADIEVKSTDEAKTKKTQLRQFCKKLNIVPMTPKEIRNKIEQINKSHGFI